MSRNNIINKIPHRDYKKVFSVRAAEPSEENGNKMIVKGRAVVFNERTVLFNYDGKDYGEIIRSSAFDETDTTQCYFKLNHDHNKIYARVKNKTLKLETNENGLDIEAEIIDTAEGRDVFEMIRTGLIDKMSFAFSNTKETFDEETRTWEVFGIGKLWDVSAVTHPAYEGTELHSLRFDQVEASRLKAVEAAEMKKREKVSSDANELLKNITKFIGGNKK